MDVGPRGGRGGLERRFSFAKSCLRHGVSATSENRGCIRA